MSICRRFAARRTQPRQGLDLGWQPPRLPRSADVLLFDLGRVVLDTDFERVMARWAADAGCQPRRPRQAALSSMTNFKHHETGKIDDAAFFADLRASLGIASRMRSSWKAGTRSSPARCRDRAVAAGAAKRMPLYAFSNTNPGHVAHFSKSLCGRTQPFPRDLPVFGNRSAKTRRRSL